MAFFLSACANSQSKRSSCLCCDKSFTSIEWAQKCIDQNPITPQEDDPRLFLIAFVKHDLQTAQKMGWEIIKDTDILQVAKEKYLLIILDSNYFNVPNGRDSELWKQIIQNKHSELFFVITNQVLYPFSSWDSNEEKKMILDRLNIGNGP